MDDVGCKTWLKNAHRTTRLDIIFGNFRFFIICFYALCRKTAISKLTVSVGNSDFLPCFYNNLWIHANRLIRLLCSSVGQISQSANDVFEVFGIENLITVLWYSTNDFTQTVHQTFHSSHSITSTIRSIRRT